MRVLVVTTNYPPHHRGGYELHCRAVVRHLRRHGHDVRVLTSTQRLGRGPEEPGVHRELESFPVVPAQVSPLDALRAEHRNAAVLERHLDDFRPHAVSWWRLGELSMSLPERVRARGIPAVGLVCDEWMVVGPERDPWCRMSGRAPDFGAAARWLFVSEHLRRAICDRVPLTSTGIARAGLDLRAFPLRPGRPPWRGRLLYAGRLSRAKGADLAVRALAHLPRGWRLTVVGDGAMREELEALAPPGRVEFRPAVAHEAMAEVLHAADALLFPARWDEPWGLVPLEAMACGVPVVATGTGGSAEYLRHEDNCLLVPGEDPRALAAAAARLADDPGLRAGLAARGRATAAEHPEHRWSAVVRDALLDAVRAQERAHPLDDGRLLEPGPVARAGDALDGCAAA